MHITNNLFSKTTLMIALFGLSNLTFAKNETPVQDSNITKNMKILLQESGGLKYSLQERYPEYYSMENANMGDKSVQIALENSNSPHDNHLKEHGGQIYQYTQSKALLTGFEFEVRKKINENFDANLVYEYLYNRQITENKKFGNYLPFTPANNLFGQINYKINQNFAHQK